MSGGIGGARQADPSPVRGGLWMVAVGCLLGLAYNWIGLRGDPAWGLSWIAVDRGAEREALTVVSAGDATSSGSSPVFSDHPMAVAGAGSGVPEIPALDQPVPLDLSAMQLYVTQRAALILDAREPEEYSEAHIPGALSMPFDEVVGDPARVESLDSRGRPIIVYCGGGGCELSIRLAWELVSAGHERVADFAGGMLEWQAAGNLVETGGAGG